MASLRDLVAGASANTGTTAPEVSTVSSQSLKTNAKSGISK